MSILNITNLTDNPEGDIKDKYLSAFEELEKEKGIEISNSDKLDYIDSQIEWLEELADDTLGKNLLGLIDNFIINNDYYLDVNEYYENNNQK